MHFALYKFYFSNCVLTYQESIDLFDQITKINVHLSLYTFISLISIYSYGYLQVRPSTLQDLNTFPCVHGQRVFSKGVIWSRMQCTEVLHLAWLTSLRRTNLFPTEGTATL